MAETFREINIILVYIGAFLAFLFALLDLTRKGKPNWKLIIVALAIFSTQIRYGFYFEGLVTIKPMLFLFLMSSVFVLGPLVLYWSISIIDLAFGKKYRFWLHMIPAIVCAIGEVIFYLQPSSSIQRQIEASMSNFQFDVLNVTIILAAVHMSVYSMLVLYLYHKANDKYDLYELRFIWAILILPVAANGFIATGFVTKDIDFSHVGAFCNVLLLVLLFIFSHRYPRFFHTFITEIANQKYKNTPLSNIDTKAVEKRIASVMLDGKLYHDPDLRMVDVASELMITGHQLSRILNEKYQKNFNEFVNSYRIDEAKELLLQKKELSILSIAYQVGFNSKSAFNVQFQKQIQTTPLKYRNQS